MGTTICGIKLMLVHISGGVTCALKYDASNFGCTYPGFGGKPMVYVTDGKGKSLEHVIVPQNHEDKDKLGGYNLTGYTHESPFLVFDLPCYYCFNKGVKYNLWYGEDLLDVYEDDNGDDTAYTDIYICPISEGLYHSRLRYYQGPQHLCDNNCMS